VSDRDFAIEFTAAASLCMVHVSRLSEELIIWMSQNFGFIKIADRFTTGSSIMPQKKNPDVPELARGKTGRVVGHLMGLITLMKGQPWPTTRTTRKTRSRCSTPWTPSRTRCASSPR
jgi:argininosuccinate lyase